MSKKFVSIVCIVLAALMLLGTLSGVLSIVARAVSQTEIDALEAQRDEIRSKQDDIKEQLEALEKDKTSALEQKAALDEQNELNRQDIELINEQIALYDSMIEEKAEELEAALSAENNQYVRYCERVRAMEENGNWSYVSFVFNATSFSDLLGRLDDVMDIVTRDQKLEADYIAAREKVERVKADYERVQASQELKKEELLQQKAHLEQQIENACALIADLEKDIATYTAVYDEAEAERTEIQARIDKMAAELKAEEERKRKAAEAAARAAAAANPSNQTTYKPVYNTTGAAAGSYLWPVSSTYITSRQGNRIHPITGTLKYHAGVDVGAASGDPISAAKGGTVTIAEYSSSYGNYVVIYHTDGTTTLYAHMSSIAVSAGQTVSRGDTIGYVGATGNVTGPHLHFEVRVNGACVDPLQYFSLGFSYAADA